VNAEPEKSALSFSKLDFVLKDKKPLTKKERSEKLSGRDYASLQKKVEKRNEMVERLRTKNPEKAAGLEERIKWDTAMKRAEGKKVKVSVFSELFGIGFHDFCAYTYLLFLGRFEPSFQGCQAQGKDQG
jgi:hypothetical protein